VFAGAEQREMSLGFQIKLRAIERLMVERFGANALCG
jgi:hypothetical protein